MLPAELNYYPFELFTWQSHVGIPCIYRYLWLGFGAHGAGVGAGKIPMMLACLSVT